MISIALRGDGAILAVGDRTGAVSLVDTLTRKSRGNPSCVNGDSENNWLAMAFSPDGQNLAIGSPEGTISLWSVAQPKSRGCDFICRATAEPITTWRSTLKTAGWPARGSDPLVEVWDLDSSSASSITAGVGRLTLDQRLQQELELAELDFAIEGVVGPVDDGDGQRAAVAVPLKHVDDPGVLDLALADADLKLAGNQARIAQVDVLNVGKNRVVIDGGMGALEKVAGVERQAQAGDELAQFHGDLGVGRQGADMREQGQHQAFAHGVARRAARAA